MGFRNDFYAKTSYWKLISLIIKLYHSFVIFVNNISLVWRMLYKKISFIRLLIYSEKRSLCSWRSVLHLSQRTSVLQRIVNIE